jgi:hypothetical protein
MPKSASIAAPPFGAARWSMAASLEYRREAAMLLHNVCADLKLQ